MTDEERLARRRAYIEAHREEIREYHRKYSVANRITHREQIRANKAKYRARLKQKQRNE